MHPVRSRVFAMTFASWVVIAAFAVMVSQLSWAARPARVRAPEAPAAPSGFVVLRLVNNATRVNTFFDRFEWVQIRSVAPKKTYVLEAARSTQAYLGAVQSTLSFGKELPPGEYRIETLGSTAGGLSTSASLADALPPFEVRSDTVTDLGTLVMQPVGGGQAVLYPLRGETPRQELIQQRLEPTDAHWADNAVLEWNADGWTPHRFAYGGTDNNSLGVTSGLVGGLILGKIDADARPPESKGWDNARTPAEFHALALGATTRLNGPAVAPDGTMYFGSLLGQVLRRTVDGEWSNLATGRLAEISAVALDGAAVIAGTEDGEILRLEGGVTTRLGRVADAGRIVDLRRWPDEAWWVVSREMLKETMENHVYVGSSLGALPSTPVKRLSQKNRQTFWTTPPPFAFPVAARQKYFLSIRGETHEYDAATGTWTDDEGKAAPDVFVNNNRSVMCSFQREQCSTDDGTTWRNLDLDGSTLALTFFDASNAIALVATDQLTWSGTQTTRRTTDGGNTWQTVNEMPGFPCDRRYLRQDDVQKRLICIFHDGGIYSTGMQGDWVRERAGP